MSELEAKLSDLRAKLSALVEAAEKFAPKCFQCGKPCNTYVDEMGWYCSVDCYNEANDDDMQRGSDSFELEETAKSLWDAIRAAMKVD
jgi:hypothetical protein